MPKKRDWWALQFVEGVKEIARLYSRFEASDDLVAFDQAKDQGDSLNGAYNLSFDFLQFVEIGRSLLAENDLPKK